MHAIKLFIPNSRRNIIIQLFVDYLHKQIVKFFEVLHRNISGHIFKASIIVSCSAKLLSYFTPFNFDLRRGKKNSHILFFKHLMPLNMLYVNSTCGLTI